MTRLGWPATLVEKLHAGPAHRGCLLLRRGGLTVLNAPVELASDPASSCSATGGRSRWSATSAAAVRGRSASVSSCSGSSSSESICLSPSSEDSSIIILSPGSKSRSKVACCSRPCGWPRQSRKSSPSSAESESRSMIFRLELGAEAMMTLGIFVARLGAAAPKDAPAHWFFCVI